MDRLRGWAVLQGNTLAKTCVVGNLIIAVMLILMLFPKPSSAQWPPFYFALTPLHENNQITYDIRFFSWTGWDLNEVTLKIPLPEGTRFKEAYVESGSTVEFDGTEVIFFTTTLRDRSIPKASFTVEIIDPTRTIFSTHAWIAWQGDPPGDYLTDDSLIDITQPTLDWEKPGSSSLQLEMSATVIDNVVTYILYPKKIRRSARMQDLSINVPVPEGATFLSAEASSPFTTNFDGHEVSFFALELTRGAEVDPLKIKVSTEGVIEPTIVTHAWATWKNAGYNVGRSIAAQEEIRTYDISINLNSTQQFVIPDPVADVPFPNYDITNLVFQPQKSAVKIIYSIKDLGPIGAPLEYILSVDSDCSSDTGKKEDGRGIDYMVRYDHQTGWTGVVPWNATEGKWAWDNAFRLKSLVDRNTITMWMPYHLLETSQLCWLARVRNNTKILSSYLPDERIPNDEDLRITQFEIVTSALGIDDEFFVAKPSAGIYIDVGDTWQYMPGWSEPPSTWMAIDFNDDTWFSGPTSIGYGTGDYATDLALSIRPVQDDDTPGLVERVDRQSGMIVAVLPSGEDITSVFMRRSFTVTNTGSLTQLELPIEYKGGFVAYLNGVEVARRGLGASGSSVSYDTLAPAPAPEAETLEVIDLSSQITNLMVGVNVLAIQSHKSSGDATHSISPKLVWEFDPADVPTDIVLLDDANVVSAPSPALMITDIKGKLAVPLDNGRVAYDIHVFSVPDGEDIATILKARQPNFRSDGQRLLINREGGGLENVYEYNLVDWTQQQVTDAPRDSHPFYDPWGNRVVYGNSELTVGSPEWVLDEHGRPRLSGIRKPFIFVQCSLLPPHQEIEPRCRDIPNLGVLVPAGQMGEIQGTHPVWTTNDMIAYKGCNTWAGSKLCGIYIVPPSSTKGFSDGFIPRQLTRDTSDTPSDTKGNLIAFSSQRDGDWEAYVMDLDGNGVRNLSNSPRSNDGLPTSSPDGNWVAFVSDRGGQWAIWVVPVLGGSPQKLFNLPSSIPWGDGDRAWINERISWGP